MNKKFMFLKISIFLLLVVLVHSNSVFAEGSDIRLLVNGDDITNLSRPVIKEDRMLVPIRFVSESLGASVQWDENNRSVTIRRNNDHIFMKIDSRLIQYNDGAQYQLSDVAPKIIDDRTYVPVRLVSNALGVGIHWDDSDRIVSIRSDEISEIEPFYDVKINNLENGSEINGKTTVHYDLPNQYKKSTYKVKLLLLDPETSEGYIKGIESVDSSSITYLPGHGDEGEKALVLGVYNASNDFVAGKAIQVKVALKPSIQLEEIPKAQNITDKVTLVPTVNFLPDYVNYEIKNIRTGAIKEVKERDPFGNYQWYPKYSDNDSYLVRALAIAGDKTVESDYRSIQVNVSPKISLSGVKENQIINGPVTLFANRNFDVNETIFMIKDLNSTQVSELKRQPYGSYVWTPGPEMSGKKALKVIVEDTKGTIRESNWVTVEIDSSPNIQIKGVGPKQVVTDTMKLDYDSNVTMNQLKYILTNLDTLSKTEYPVENLDSEFTLSINPLVTGNYSLKAIGQSGAKVIESEGVTFRVYKEKLYSAKAITEKSKFLGFASKMALESYKKTDMSAALQTAQGILETGWGQSVPVDKYSGKFSNNLFGIKGSASNGSVTSNTWEVYNGIVYRVDDYFRAYNTVDESWQDHKDLLLKASRYSIFRDVMYDSSLGAWAIRRAGYATDPQYPLKLMRIIKEYNLETLDKIDL